MSFSWPWNINCTAMSSSALVISALLLSDSEPAKWTLICPKWFFLNKVKPESNKSNLFWGQKRPENPISKQSVSIFRTVFFWKFRLFLMVKTRDLFQPKSSISDTDMCSATQIAVPKDLTNTKKLLYRSRFQPLKMKVPTSVGLRWNMKKIRFLGSCRNNFKNIAASIALSPLAIVIITSSSNWIFMLSAQAKELSAFLHLTFTISIFSCFKLGNCDKSARLFVINFTLKPFLAK